MNRGYFLLIIVALSWNVASAQQRRAPAPKFSNQEINRIFFEDLNDAFGSQRPSLSAIRKSSAAAAVAASRPSSSQEASPDGDRWTSLISVASLEDEVKQVRLHYDGVVTTPGEFNSGGFQQARLDLTVLATLFAVITDYDGDVRWKKDAPAARDLIARTAFNCKAGSNQVYNEAKLRKADLQDLVSGAGLASRESEGENDWSTIADRSPLMEYAERLIESLEDEGRDQAAIESNSGSIRRRAELLAMLGEVLVQEGMDEAGDEDYEKLSRDMSKSAREVVSALDRSDADAVRIGIGDIRSRCDSCHEQYR